MSNGAASMDVTNMPKREECVSHMVQRWCDAAMKVVPIKHRREEYVSRMVQSWSNVALRFVPTELSRGEFVSHMAQRRNDVASRVVQTIPGREEFATGTAQTVYLWLTTHCKKQSPPYQSINYEYEEELNSWIWKSSSMKKSSCWIKYNMATPFPHSSFW